MNLPEAIAPWADAFAAVSADVALSLGPSVARLAAAVGPLRTRTLYGTGDPDGYDGLTRRGAYERLLLSEWALSEEAPDEFLRRAATRELGFHQLVYRETAKARASVLLFDAGPTELGSPRIAHLAALLVMAQRAHDAGARFAWGVLQLPPDAPVPSAGLHLDLTPDNVDLLRVARQCLGPGDADLDAWAELEGRAGSWDDLWIVGPAETASRWRSRVARRAGSTGGFIEVCEVATPGARSLDVRVLQRSTTRVVTLDLPDAATCVRLVRNPLRRIEPPKPAVSVGRAPARVPNRTRPVLSNPLMVSHGTKVIARTSDGALLVFGVPGSSRGGTPRPRVVMPRPGEKILAAGWGHRRLVMVSDYLGALRLHDWNGNLFPWATGARDASDVARAAILEAGGADEHLPAVYVHQLTLASRRTASMLDRQGRLWRLDPEDVQLAASEVVSVQFSGELLIVRSAVHDEGARNVVLPAAGFPGEAVEKAPGEWTLELFKGKSTGEVTHVPPDARVIGVGGYANRSAPPMICVAADGRTIVQHTGAEVVRIHAAEAPIVHAVVEAFGARIAYVTDGGVLGVYESTRADLLMRYTPGAWR